MAAKEDCLGSAGSYCSASRAGGNVPESTMANEAARYLLRGSGARGKFGSCLCEMFRSIKVCLVISPPRAHLLFWDPVTSHLGAIDRYLTRELSHTRICPSNLLLVSTSDGSKKAKKEVAVRSICPRQCPFPMQRCRGFCKKSRRRQWSRSRRFNRHKARSVQREERPDSIS